MSIKQILLGSRFGEIGMFAREKVELLHLAFFRPEAIGTLANDQLAGRLVTSICGRGKTFLDVGAHIGSVMSAVRQHDPSTKIIAVEAIPEKAEQLRKKFPNADVHSCAVSEANGSTTFYIDTQRTGYSSLISPEGSSASRTRKIQVDLKRLDDLFPDHNDIDVIKIDVEGAELGALRGATSLIARNSPVVMFESGPAQEDSPYSKVDLFQFFQQRDYVVVVPNRLAHNDAGLSEEGFLEGHLYPRRATNYFAVPKARHVEIRDKARTVLRIPSK